MRYYDINYTSFSDGTVLVQYRDKQEAGVMQTTYQALRRNMDSAIEYMDKLNGEGKQ
jgi:hypothetical protein